MFHCFIIHFLLCTIVSPPAPEYSNGVGDHHSQNSSYESQNISPEHVYSFEDFETDVLEASGDELVFIFIYETQGGIMCLLDFCGSSRLTFSFAQVMKVLIFSVVMLLYFFLLLS